MNHTISSNNIKEDNIGTASAGVDLNKFVPSGGDVLTRGGFKCGGTRGDVLPLNVGAWHHVPQEHCLQGLLVCQETI